MPDDPRVQQLLDELLDSHGTPEEVCGSCPEMLPQVRERWRQLCRVRAELDALFPPATDAGTVPPAGGPLPTVPGYEVEAVLGCGGMGVVFRARHQRLNRVVALKMAATGAYAGPQERVRFQREAEAIAALHHPNVVQIHDSGDADGRPYFTMEYVEGGSLAQKLDGTPRPARDAASLLVALAGAVQAAHDQGIVHRDLKPANVLLAADGTPKVGDFGLARRLGGEAGLTRPGTAVGTPSYMAPEQARGTADLVGPPADIYALGAVLYEVLTGRPPFRAETAEATVQQLLHQDPVPPSRLNRTVPRDLETVCLKCLSKDARFRYSSAAALADDLSRFLRGESVTARPESPAARLFRRGRRRPVLSAAVGVATLSTVTLAGVGGWVLTERAAAARVTAAMERAADDDLKEMAGLMERSAWAPATAARERANGRLGDSPSVELRRRLEQGTRDLELVAALEEIRLLLSGAGNSHPANPLSPERLYADAFRKSGIDLLTLDPAEAAARIRGSAVRETLLAFLHDWLYWISDTDRARVQAVADGADDDGWRRSFREAIAVKDKDYGRLKALATAPEAAAQPPVIISGLCGSLLAHHQREEALAVLNEAQQRHPGDFWVNYLLGHFWGKERPQHAVGYLRAAVAVRPSSDQAYCLLAKALRDTGAVDEAEAAFLKAAALNPSRSVVAELAKLLAPTGRLAEVRVAWERLLERDPPDHNSWYGYAQLCLYLGDEAAYRRARTSLLDRFGHTTGGWSVAERTALACLLLPASGDDLRRAVGWVDRAVSAGPKPPHPDHAYIQFVKGLAEYRQGRPEQAVSHLDGAAETLTSRPGPRLMLAMAQFRTGSPVNARRTLASAVLSFDWNPSRADHTTAWVSHVLRREAERLILANLPAFLEGAYQPQDNDERIAFLGVSQATNRTLASARLYADAFAAAPNLAADCRAAHRTNAARAAALAGCGRGTDAARLSEPDRATWRARAVEWLRADLAAWEEALDGDPTGVRDAARQRIIRWRTDPGFVGLREPAELAKLPAEERKGCVAFWNEVGEALVRFADIR